MISNTFEIGLPTIIRVILLTKIYKFKWLVNYNIFEKYVPYTYDLQSFVIIEIIPFLDSFISTKE